MGVGGGCGDGERDLAGTLEAVTILLACMRGNAQVGLFWELNPGPLAP